MFWNGKVWVVQKCPSWMLGAIKNSVAIGSPHGPYLLFEKKTWKFQKISPCFLDRRCFSDVFFRIKDHWIPYQGETTFSVFFSEVKVAKQVHLVAAVVVAVVVEEPFLLHLQKLLPPLVGGFNPSEKNQSTWESSPIFGVKIKKYLSCHRSLVLFMFRFFSNFTGRRGCNWRWWHFGSHTMTPGFLNSFKIYHLQGQTQAQRSRAGSLLHFLCYKVSKPGRMKEAHHNY